MSDNIENVILFYSQLLRDYRQFIRGWKKNDYKIEEILSNVFTLKAYLSLYSPYLKLISEKDINNYQEQIKSLLNIKNQSDQVFNHLVLKNLKSIKNILYSLDIPESMKLLEKFFTCYESFTVSEEKDKHLSLMEKFAQSFLSKFFAEKLLCKEIKNCFEKEVEKEINFIQQIEITEQFLRTNFYYWSDLTDIRENFFNEIHKNVLTPRSEFWWLFDNPSSEPYIDIKSSSKKVAEKLISLCSTIDFPFEIKKRFPDSYDCPGEDQLILFASDELSAEEASSVKKHLLICDQCAREVSVLQPIIQEPVSNYDNESFVLPDSVKEAMEKELTYIARKKQSFSEKLSLTAEKVTKKIRSGRDYLKAISSSIAEEFIISVSQLWEPQLVGQLITASDVSKQKHRFLIDQGQITVTCNWQGANESEPAYLLLSWKANFSIVCEIWAKFENPDTNEIFSEICLGTSMVGETYFTSKDLGFDPSKVRWAMAIILAEEKK